MRKGFLYQATGDSITWLKNSGTPSMTLGADFYATKIRNYIRTSEIGGCRLLNKGMGGSTSKDMVLNLPWLGSSEADLVTIGIGTNDCINGPVTIADYKINLGKLIDKFRLQNPNVKIILCTPPRTLDTARQAVIQPYRDAMAEVSVSKNTGLCRWENAWLAAADSTNISTDNVHMTPAGHTALYNTLLPVVKSVLGIS